MSHRIVIEVYDNGCEIEDNNGHKYYMTTGKWFLSTSDPSEVFNLLSIFVEEDTK